jgi:hypothetical protein
MAMDNQHGLKSGQLLDHHSFTSSMQFSLQPSVAHNTKVRLKFFEKLKPYYVYKLKERNTYSCKYHVEMQELQDGFNDMRGIKWVHGEHCNYTYDVCVGSASSACMAGCTKFYGLTNMWMSILCPASEESTFHSLKCLEGKCDNCGIDMLITYPIEEKKSSKKLMTWKCYEKFIHGRTRARANNKVLRLQYKETIVAKKIPTPSQNCINLYCTIL